MPLTECTVHPYAHHLLLGSRLGAERLRARSRRAVGQLIAQRQHSGFSESELRLQVGRAGRPEEAAQQDGEEHRAEQSDDERDRHRLVLGRRRRRPTDKPRSHPSAGTDC